MVTKSGNQFSSRVASSLLNSIGLEEMITKNQNDYESLILDLAVDKNKLSMIKEKLKKNISNLPLFNNQLYARNFEKGLKLIYSDYLNKKNLIDIEVI